MNTKFETNTKKSKFDLRGVTFTVPADLVELEHHVLELWNDLNLVELVKAKNKGNTKFSFFDGPVTANNPLGVHHAWGRTLKDVVQRYKSLKGFDQRFEYGFDTQGLWVEVEVEKALGFNSKQELEEFGVDKFVEACKERVNHYSEVQNSQSLRLGMLKSAKSYYTHTDQNVSAIWNFLKTCHENNWLYKGVRPMPWCPRCGTSLSSHEQADSYKEVEHTALYVKFPVNEKDNTYFVVWTTTPWTLPANLAVAVHPDKKYGFFTNGKETLVAGVWLQDTLMSNFDLREVKLGVDLVHFTYSSPFDDLPAQYLQTYTVVKWSEVSQEEGTGVVHLAPGCGQEDYQLLKDDLTPLSPLSEDGTFESNYGKYSGHHYSIVNKMVADELTRRDLVFVKEQYLHRYPHCWRCKTELVYRLVDEWFLSMDEIRPLLVEAAEQVQWNPQYIRKLFLDWVSNMSDWCVSRKRYWGLPLPFYECSCGHLTVVGSKNEFLENAVGKVDLVKELHLPWVDKVQYPCQACGQLVDRVREVGDCWLDAGVMPFSTLDYFSEDQSLWESWYPAEFVCEMREQVRLWFYSLMVLSVTLVGKPAFKTVLSYEKVKDKHNFDMHKSGKNNVVLDDAMEYLSADTLRMYYLTQSRSSNMRFDFEVGEALFKLLRRLVHSFKFFQTYADLESYQFDHHNYNNNVDDKWMLSRLDFHVESYTQKMERFEFQDVLTTLHEVVDDLSSWYLRRVRDRVWNKYNGANYDVYHTLFRVFRQLSVMFAPVTPFLSEIVYQNLRNYDSRLLESVHLEKINMLGNYDEVLEKGMMSVRSFDEMNRQLRNELGLKLRQPLSKAYLWSNNLCDLTQQLQEGLTDLLNVKTLEFLEDPTKYVRVNLKPNFKVTGPKYGKDVQKLSSLLESLDYAQSAYFALGDEQKLKVGQFELSREEVEVRLEPLQGLKLNTSGQQLLLLNAELTPDLEKEGWLRDFVRLVQTERKELDLHVEERVALLISGSSTLTTYLGGNEAELRDLLYLSELILSEEVYEKKFYHTLGEVSYMLVKDRS